MWKTLGFPPFTDGDTPGKEDAAGRMERYLLECFEFRLDWLQGHQNRRLDEFLVIVLRIFLPIRTTVAF